MNHRQLLKFSFILSIIFIVSCKKDSEPVVPIEFFNDGDHIFTYACNNDKVDFFIDAIRDTTNQTEGAWPDVDIYRLLIDFNNNGMLDADVDLQISPLEDNRICVVYALTNMSTTPCFFPEDVSGEVNFSNTENAATLHTNFKVSVPKALLSNGSTANVAIHVYDSENGWSYIPPDNNFYRTTFEITW